MSLRYRFFSAKVVKGRREGPYTFVYSLVGLFCGTSFKFYSSQNEGLKGPQNSTYHSGDLNSDLWK